MSEKPDNIELPMATNPPATPDVPAPHAPAVGTAYFLFADGVLNSLERFANVMAEGRATIPKHLQGSPADCLAVTMQAAQWGMNPYSVAQKTHLINGTLGYEAQLVNAVVSSSKAIVGRFHYQYGTDDGGLWCRVGATIAGESAVTWSEPVYQNTQLVQNSPLWKSNPKQQLGYLAVKMWCRQYTPAVILGVYTPDEIEERGIRDMGQAEVIPEPATRTDSVKAKLATKAEKVNKPKLDDIMKAIDAADTKAELDRAVIHANTLSSRSKHKAREAYAAKLATIKSNSEANAKPTLSDIIADLKAATTPQAVVKALTPAAHLSDDDKLEAQAVADKMLVDLENTTQE